jgi:Ran GTPase-activating protein (RanGAP) involved in mRNA processing and transport
MPLDPDRLKEAGDKASSISKRMDALMERREMNDADEDQDEDEDEDEDQEEFIEEELREPAEQVLNETPGSDLPNTDINEPWYGRNK